MLLPRCSQHIYFRNPLAWIERELLVLRTQNHACLTRPTVYVRAYRDGSGKNGGDDSLTQSVDQSGQGLVTVHQPFRVNFGDFGRRDPVYVTASCLYIRALGLAVGLATLRASLRSDSMKRREDASFFEKCHGYFCSCERVLPGVSWCSSTLQFASP